VQHNAHSGTPSTRVAIATCINGAWMDTEHEQLGRRSFRVRRPLSAAIQGVPGARGAGGGGERPAGSRHAANW
jgi:hypothetical protein